MTCLQIATGGDGLSARRMSMRPETPCYREPPCYEMLHRALGLESLDIPKQKRKRSISSSCWTGSLRTVASEIAKYFFKSWATQNFITIKTSWNTND
jgi:hypothetical protein